MTPSETQAPTHLAGANPSTANPARTNLADATATAVKSVCTFLARGYPAIAKLNRAKLAGAWLTRAKGNPHPACPAHASLAVAKLAGSRLAGATPWP